MKSTIVSMIVVLFLMMSIPILFLGENNLADRFGFGFNFSKSGSSGVPAKLPSNVQAVTTRTRVEIYTWVDENGVTQFSQTPESEGKVSVKMVLKPNTNIMDPVKIPEEAEPKLVSGPRVYSIKNPYSPSGMKDVVDDSMGARDSMNERTAEQDKMMGELFPGQFEKKR